MEDGRSFQFTKDDLRTAISVLKHGKNDVISNQIRKILRNGLYNNIPSPISKKSYYLWYGHSTGNMKLVDDYVMMADMLTSYSNATYLNSKTFSPKIQTIRLSPYNNHPKIGPHARYYQDLSKGLKLGTINSNK